jgi:AraC-like DNA-binding protein
LPARRITIDKSVPRARFVELGQLPISIQLGGHRAETLYWGFFDARYWRNYLHTHSFYEICFAWKGSGVFRMLGTDYAVKTGDVFIAKPGEPHEIISNRRDPLGIYYWAYTLKRVRLSDVAAAPVDVLLDRFAQSACWVVHNPASIATTVQLLTEEIANRSAGYPLVINGLVAKLLLDACRAVVDKARMGQVGTGEAGPLEEVHPRAQSEAHAMVETASRYIRDNLARPISLRDVAAQVNVSERHLGRLFKQIRKMTVLDYITHARIQSACGLLLDPQLTVKMVASKVGFPDVRYFTTVFGKHMKITPAVFRNRRGTAFVDETRRGKHR